MKKITLLTWALGLGFFTNLQAQYCTPTFSGGCGTGEEIESFEIPDAEFTHLNTGCSTAGYGDYTSTIITFAEGVNYDYSVSFITAFQSLKIWIDFNDDEVFDTSELISEDTTFTFNDVLAEGTIAIPAGANLGLHRMRVMNRYATTTYEACGSGNAGEAHDYMVDIVESEGLSISSFENLNFGYYPNPVDNELKITSHNTINQVVVYNLIGQVIKAVNPNKMNAVIDFSDLQAGTYLLKVTVNGNANPIRIVKK